MVGTQLLATCLHFDCCGCPPMFLMSSSRVPATCQCSPDDQHWALFPQLPTDWAAVDGSMHLLLGRDADHTSMVVKQESVIEFPQHAMVGHQQASSRPELRMNTHAADATGLHMAAALDALPATATSKSLASSRHRGARTPCPPSETIQSAGKEPGL